MRLSLLVAALSALAACTLTPPQNQRADLNKYVEPTNGAAYSQGDIRYYQNGVNPGYQGPSNIPVHHP
jgi:hypothetical protein